jgi:hypothetical protein
MLKKAFAALVVGSVSAVAPAAAAAPAATAAPTAVAPYRRRVPFYPYGGCFPCRGHESFL